jgi:hypothetical protein
MLSTIGTDGGEFTCWRDKTQLRAMPFFH